jgi:hypothetical protein
VGNNDLLFLPDFGEALCRKVGELSRLPVIAPNIITIDDAHQNPHVIKPVGRLRELIYDAYYANYALARLILWLVRVTRSISDREDETHHAVAQFIHQGYGACYILTKTFFVHFDELWAPTFLMGEEYFLAKQLEDKGFRVFYEPSIVVRHHGHATLENVPSRMAWEYARAAHRVYRRYVKPWRVSS